ncbi:MAG: CvpA family protein, partial [Planctomycetales bacterium]|nr:CvpA family protein [Planctomycetales bacterium]
MQAYDLIMLIVLGMATIFGAIKGFAWQVASLASIVVSYVVAYRFRFQVAEMIQAQPPWNQFLAMLILYVGSSFLIWVGFRLLSTAIDRVRLKEFDRHLGAAFGLAKGLVYCLLITMFATSLLGPNQQAAICNSRSGYYIATALDHGMGILPKEIHEVVGPYLARLDEKLKHDHVGEEFAEGDERDWVKNGIPDLERLPGLEGMSNIPERLQTGIRDALPRLLPGGGPGNVPGGNSTEMAPSNWSQNLPSFDTAGLEPGSILPPAGGPSTAPQIYPPLGQPLGQPGTQTVPNRSSGLRPSGATYP